MGFPSAWLPAVTDRPIPVWRRTSANPSKSHQTTDSYKDANYKSTNPVNKIIFLPKI